MYSDKPAITETDSKWLNYEVKMTVVLIITMLPRDPPPTATQVALLSWLISLRLLTGSSLEVEASTTVSWAV